MLVFGRFNKCVINKNNLYFLMTKHYKFCRWETEDKINAFCVWAEPALSDDSTWKDVAKKFEEYGASDVGYGNSLLLNIGVIAEKDLHSSITKLFCQHDVSVSTKLLENNGMVYKASSYSTNFCDGEAISKILIALSNKVGSITTTTFIKKIDNSAIEKVKELIDSTIKDSEAVYSICESENGEKWIEVVTKSESAKLKVEKILSES